MTRVIGDVNAKIGYNNADMESAMGQHGLGSMNENDEIFADFCVSNRMVIGVLSYPIGHATKLLGDHLMQELNQIDYITINRRWRSPLQDLRVRRDADVGSDHHLVVAQLKLKLAATKKRRP